MQGWACRTTQKKKKKKKKKTSKKKTSGHEPLPPNPVGHMGPLDWPDENLAQLLLNQQQPATLWQELASRGGLIRSGENQKIRRAPWISKGIKL